MAMPANEQFSFLIGLIIETLEGRSLGSNPFAFGKEIDSAKAKSQLAFACWLFVCLIFLLNGGP
jgi:hypothetical protein